MNSKIKDTNTDFLFQAILQLHTMEIKALSQRIVVAKMLSDKRVYSDIVAATGASTATISRVNRSLIYGCDAYDMVFSRMLKEDGE